jgi:hypothetical protein
MKKLSFIFTIAMTAFLFSCKGEYEVQNMENEMIDVTEYIRDEGWLAYTCNNHLVGIINPAPHVPNAADNASLRASYMQGGDYGDLFRDFLVPPNTYALSNETRYVYSYFIFDVPVDVYITTFTAADKTHQLYVRYSEGKFWGQFDEDGWIICSTNP